MRKFVFAAIAVLTFSAAAAAVDFDTRACLSPTSTVFVSGMQRWVRMKDSKRTQDRADRTRFTPTATAIGYEYSVQNWSAGLSMSYESGNIKHDVWADGTYDGEYFKIRDRTLGFTLFGTYRFGDGLYAKGSTFLGFTSQKLKDGWYGNSADRYSSRGSASSTRFALSLEMGKAFELSQGFRVTPHFGLDYSHTPSKAVRFWDETGDPDDLRLRSMNVYEVPLGVTFAKDYLVGCDWVITPSVDLTMITRFGHIAEENRNGRPGFASRTGSEWKIYGVGASHWGGRITTGVKAVKSERFDLDLNYAYEGRKKYSDHRISLSAGFSF